MYKEDYKNENLPGPVFTMFIIIFCIAIGILDLGNNWYEIILRILAFLFALSIAFIIYSFVTNLIVLSNSPLKRFYHLIMLLIFPLIIYLGLIIYLL